MRSRNSPKTWGARENDPGEEFLGKFRGTYEYLRTAGSKMRVLYCGVIGDDEQEGC